MQQHPVPQNITGFEFKLIGFLTLRQFGYLGVAAVVTFILYSAKVPFLVMVFIAGPIVLLALALAFLPINDLPFERWLAAFLKTVYSPNTRVWHREPKSIGFLEPQFSVYLHRQSEHIEPKVVKNRSTLDNYLKTHRKLTNKSLVDINEERRLAQLEFPPTEKEAQIFSTTNLAPRDFTKTGYQNTPRFKRMDELGGEG